MELGLWIIIFVFAIALEAIAATDLSSIWFSVGAIAALIAMQMGLSFAWQAVIFFVVSLTFIIVCRPIVKKYMKTNFIPTNADRVIGQQARLISPITSDTWGSVKIQGVEWHSVSVDGNEIAQGELVEVLAIDGSKVIVKKI